MNGLEKYIDVNEFIYDFLRDDISYDDKQKELAYLKNAKAILSSEILSLYEFLDNHNLIDDYKRYLNGDDDLPFND